MQIWAESGKSALPICNYSQILYQFLTFTQNLKRSLDVNERAVFIRTQGCFFVYTNSDCFLNSLPKYLANFPNFTGIPACSLVK